MTKQYYFNTDVQFDVNDIWADIVVDPEGKRWTAKLGAYRENERKAIVLWERGNYRSQHASEAGMEAARKKLLKRAEGWGSYED